MMINFHGTNGKINSGPQIQLTIFIDFHLANFKILAIWSIGMRDVYS
jgi:hypothetical protein